MEDEKLTITDYGIYILSPLKMREFLKENKIRSKKVLVTFQKNQELYLKSLEDGSWVPILPIDSIKYIVNISNLKNSFDETSWKEMFSLTGFNLSVSDDDCIWIGSFGNLLNWDSNLFIDAKDDKISYQTLDGITNNKAFKFNIEKGKYLVTIEGYKRKETLPYPEANNGFLFTLTKVEEFDGYKDPREHNKYYFNVAQL